MRKHPSYLNLSLSSFKQRIRKAFQMLESCRVCPRKCGVNRLKGERGFCQAGKEPVVSSYGPHFGEEAVLVGPLTNSRIGGSGTIFFTHCNLACVYCQNYDISQLGVGQEISLERLAEMMIELQERGCYNINFVSPTPYVPQILGSLPLAIKAGLRLPLVYNTNTYDSLETLKLLAGIIDIYMPDTKYASEKTAQKYSLVPSYPQVMEEAIKEMHCQVGDLVIKPKTKNQIPKIRNQKLKIRIRDIPEGKAIRGLLVRHLVLPNNLAGSKEIFQFLVQEISKNTFVNIMAQYHPCYKAEQYPPLDRPLFSLEHQKAIALAKKAGLKRIYW